MPTMSLPTLRLPKPVLRKQHYPENPSEPIEGLSHPSEIEARHRAGRLAESVSGVVSRASPDDSPVMGNFDDIGLLNGTEARDYAAATGAAKSEDDADQSGLKFRQRVEADADRLDPEEIRSGAATPVAYDLEFVPPAPTNYHGDWSEIVTDKLKRERNEREQRPRKEHKRKPSKTAQQKVEQLQIKKHIAEIISRHKYMVKLCRALMEFGAPTHRLEAYMAMSARVLAIEGQFLYLPGCMIISFDDTHTHTTEVKIVRVPQGVDLGKLRDVHEIYKLVVHDLIGVDEAMSRLDAVVTRKHKFNKWIRVVTYGLAAVCVAPFAFQGRWIDMPIAFVMGCIVGLMQLIMAPSSELYANVFETSAALLMSFLGRMFGSIQYKGENLFCFSALAQASIALILPGYMVLCGSLELQSHNMIAGSVRMVYAMIYTLFLGYGITIGAVLYGLMDKNATSSTSCSNPLNSYWDLLFVPLFTLCLCVINQAKYKQLPVMLTISFAGYVVNSYTNKSLNSSTISNTLGALTIGVLANLYSRLSRPAENFWLRLKLRKVNQDLEKGIAKANEDPETTARRVGYGLAAAAMLPAIFVQVPSGLASGGSLVSGVTSADAITGNKTAAASTTGASDLNTGAFTVLLSVIQVAISISVGLGLAALLVYPFGKRRSGLFSF
ncbi:putative pheromone-regulated membrane protein [Diaporthe ampelina]|uniref:Putative pheromone-regulated membrane protein n=1 Tax=Diaporthe ampelina TaxID=1214573 RepID=A0A0G2FU54_9PEZI|nr:putative pheromone-regulated membrane protein [Diaporthe ampelina]